MGSSKKTREKIRLALQPDTETERTERGQELIPRSVVSTQRILVKNLKTFL